MSYHLPVMPAETLRLLNPLPGQTVVDATLGGGGHSLLIAPRLRPGGRLIGIDQDPEAQAEAARALEPFADIVTFAPERFDRLADILDRLHIDTINGILFDLGVSSHQLDTPARGFSFRDPAALLDMRMNPAGGGQTAADLLNTLPEAELTRVLRDYADEKWAARIAQFAAQRRQQEPYRAVGQLIDTVHAAIPVRARPPDTHAATRTFQALRIAVNDELAVLERALDAAVARLAPGGVVVALSYHSLEDRIVKTRLARWAGRGPSDDPYGRPPPASLELLTRRPLAATPEETRANPRARSAKLRAARKRSPENQTQP